MCSGRPRGRWVVVGIVRAIASPVTIRAVALLLAAVLAGLGACADDDADGDGRTAADGTVTVASFNFPESQGLGELYTQALRARGIRAVHEEALGPREFVGPALEQGRVDMVPEYLGTAYSFYGGTGRASSEALYDTLAERDLRTFEPAPAQNQNGFVVTRSTSLIYGLRMISDLEPVAGTLVFGGPPECPERPYCLPGLEDHYGLTFERFVPLDSGGPLTLSTLRLGEVEVVLLFSTDGVLAGSDDLVMLEDDRGLQPPENIVPMVRDAVVERHGARVASAVDEVSRQLTQDELRRLNMEIALEGRTPATVARRWLRDQGL
jgi:osmoprotectant transport system substrate-binding protein